MEEPMLQEKIKSLIDQLELEADRINRLQKSEIDGLLAMNSNNLQGLGEQLERHLFVVSDTYQTRISLLEDEANYLRELTRAQRSMMENNMEYIKRLEDKLSTSGLSAIRQS